MSDFDIDRFPTSETAKRMLSRVSPIYQKAYVAKWLYQVMGIELDDVEKRFEELRDQRFADTVTWGIEYLEYKYSITPDTSLSLSERRSRIKRKLRKRAPLNPWRFEKLIYDAFGVKIIVDETKENGVLHVSIPRIDESLSDPNLMIKEMRRIKPAHLQYVITLERYVELTDDEKIRVGLINANAGIKHIGIPKVPEIESRVTAGVVLMRAGAEHIAISSPASWHNTTYVGVYRHRTGRITIGGIK